MCRISIPCQLHRDTSRILDQCSDKLHRGACSKNTVRYIKNGPALACTQCSTRISEQKSRMPSEHIKCEGNGRLMSLGSDNNDPGISWTEENHIENSSTQIQPTLLAPPYSRPVSTNFDSHSSGYHEPGEYDLTELSHEEGLHLIDDMYGTQDPDFIPVDHPDSNDDEVYFAWSGSTDELEEAHKMTEEITYFIQNNENEREDVYITLGSSSISSSEGPFTPVGSENSNNAVYQAHTPDARDVVWQTRQKPETFQHIRGEMEPRFLWCSDEFRTPMQVWVEDEL